MRLNSDQVKAIKQAAQQVLGDDALRGGDIDLLFETPHPVVNRATTTGQLYVKLIRHLGDRKIDVLLKDATTAEAPVMRVARETGVLL